MATFSNQKENFLSENLKLFLEESISDINWELANLNLPYKQKLKKLKLIEIGREILQQLNQSPSLKYILDGSKTVDSQIYLDNELRALMIFLRLDEQSTNKISYLYLNAFENGEQRTES